MTAEHLLHELETLTYAARIRRMVDYGRAAIHDPEGASTLTPLEQGDFYQRFLALYACFGGRDGAHVLRVLIDPSRIIRGMAINLTPLVCDEAQLWQALEIVPRDGRRSLLWKLHHHGYDALINHFLEQPAEIHDHQLRELLPCGSSTLVRRQWFVDPIHRIPGNPRTPARKAQNTVSDGWLCALDLPTADHLRPGTSPGDR